ncbi:MAG: hypothetical protein HN366_04290, partial [Deltaproteobacteria bacterium]|nr:hypothetical protein [Deltaproteobacteria bacterium]
MLARHHPLDIAQSGGTMLGSGVDVDAAGHVVSLRAKDLSVLVPSHIPARKLNIGKKSSAYLLLAYGGGYRSGPRGEDFEFTDPLFRRTRFHSLLTQDAPLTHPVDFINRLRYKGIRWGRIPSRNVLRALCAQLSKQLDIPTDSWPDVDADMVDAWNTLPPWQQRAVLPILDMARQMMDAFPRSATPLEMPGVVLMDQPETFCPSERFKDYLTLLDKLFPRLQFILSAGAGAMERFPPTFRQQRLPIPYNGIPQTKSRPVRLPRDTILLIDVDGRLPNLALMKLSAHYRSNGQTVWLGKNDCFLEGPDRVYASTLFYSPRSERRNERLRLHYGDRLTLGGTGDE